MPDSSLPVEIAVQDAAGVRIALEAGAARVELCQALALGGLTPSAGLIEAAVEAATAASAAEFVHVLVRPRGGGFVYDAEEIGVIVRDIRLVRSLGADGVVVGALTDAGALDLDAIAAFLDAADGLDVTVHRAVDASADPLAAIRALAGTGVRRVLTSGGAADCRTGRETLALMVAEVRGALELMAGGGVGVDDIAALAAVGVDAVHLSARHRASRGGPSGPGGGEIGFDVTDAELVRAAVAAARAAVR
jgi:copper homeostasis protein